MHWIAPTEKDTDNAALEKRLWDTADTATRVSANPECEATWRDFRQAKDHWSANSGLKAQEYVAESEVQGAKCEVPSIRHSSFVIRNLHRLSIQGVEKTDETGHLCRLNLAGRGSNSRFERRNAFENAINFAS